jgi:hypothetical protein
VSRPDRLFLVGLLFTACAGSSHHAATQPTAVERPPARTTATRPTATTRDTIVAVFDIEDSSNQFDPKTTDQLTEYLASRVNEVAGYRVIPRVQVRERLQQEKAEGYKACYEQACQIELGKALAAQKSLATKVLQVGSACLMTATLYDLKTETTERSVTAKTECTPTSLISGADYLAQELRAQAY